MYVQLCHLFQERPCKPDHHCPQEVFSSSQIEPYILFICSQIRESFTDINYFFSFYLILLQGFPRLYFPILKYPNMKYEYVAKHTPVFKHTRIYNILLVNVTNFFARYPSCWSLFSFWIMYALRYGLAKKIRIALTDERSVWNLSHIIIRWEACVDATNGKPI